MMHMTTRRLVATLTVSVSLAACGGSQPAPAPAPAPQAAPAPAAPPAQTAPAGGTAAEGVKAPEEGPIFVVYRDAEDPSNHYISGGFMGDVKAITVDAACAVQPQSGTTCQKWTYDLALKEQGWAGVFWQDPEGNWNGEEAKAGYNLSKAKTLKFWARGEMGGETLKFGFGGNTGKFGDTGKTEKTNIKLTKVWQEFEIPLAGLDLSRIVFGFMWAIDSKQNSGQKITFYLDDIRYEF